MWPSDASLQLTNAILRPSRDQVGAYRQFTRDYGLTPFASSPAFYSGLVMLVIIGVAFGWNVYHIDRQTRDRV